MARDTTPDPKTASKAPETDLPTNTVKDPENWTTGGETMKTLCEEASETFDPSLTKADASKRIDALQASTGRGRNH
jgi:hypothetical protein